MCCILIPKSGLFLVLTWSLLLTSNFLWNSPYCIAYLSMTTFQDFCDSFDVNMKPLICIIKESKFVSSNSTTPRSEGWGWGWESSESDESPECSCDLKCLPRFGLNDTDTLRCRQCGTCCDVKTSLDSNCACTTVGNGLTNSTCNCTVACARGDACEQDHGWGSGSGWGSGWGWARMGGSSSGGGWGWKHHNKKIQQAFCIFNVTGLPNAGRSVTCECCKSNAANRNPIPDFVCICQRNSLI